MTQSILCGLIIAALAPVDEPQARTVGARTGKVCDIAFRPDGKAFVVSRQWHARTQEEPDPGVEVYQITDSGVTLQGRLDFAERQASAVRFSPDSRRLATAGADKVRLWDAGTLKLVSTIDGQPHAEVAFVPGKPWLVTGGAIWDTETGALVRRIPFNGWVSTFDVDLTGRWLAARERDGITVRELATGEISRVLDSTEHIDRQIRFDATGRWLAWIRDSSYVVIWDAKEWKLAGQTEKHKLYSLMSAPGGCFAFSPDGTRLFTGTGYEGDSKIREWKVPTGELMRVIGTHNGAVLCLAHHPTKPQLASGSGMEKYVLSVPSDVESAKLWTYKP